MDHNSAENGRRTLEFQSQIPRPGALNLGLPTAAELKATMSLGGMSAIPLLPMEATSDQKNYAQGFLDALNSIHNLNKFEFEAKKELLSPGFLAPLIGSTNGTVDIPSPFATPSNRELQAILQAMVSTPTGAVTSTASVLAAAAASLNSPFNILPGPSIMTMPPSTSAQPIAEKSLQADPLDRVEVKQERAMSEDTSDNNSERSRSSSVTMTGSGSYISKSHKGGNDAPFTAMFPQQMAQLPSPMFDVGSSNTGGLHGLHPGLQMYHNYDTTQHYFGLTPQEQMTMDEQEQRKLERKRARNRAAASKCRQKKMDRISELEILVQNEKQRGQSLDSEMARMHNLLGQLQRLVERHSQKGCNTMSL